MTDMKTSTQAAAKFRIVARPFGYPMYASPAGVGWSDVEGEAHVYDHRDNPETKLRYWRADLTNNGLDADTAAVEYVQ